MTTLAVSTRTICGIEELPQHGAAGVTHVLSILDPGYPELSAFGAYGEHRRTTLHFHDIIDPAPGQVMPAGEHVDAILRFGAEMDAEAEAGAAGHLLVHCHMGVSRSTAAMLMLMASGDPDASEAALFERLRTIRPKAWPNSVMVAMADERLGRNGRLVAELRRHYARQIAAHPAVAGWMRELKRGREVDMAEPA